MYNHAPPKYISPFVRLIQKDGVDDIHSNEEDVVYRDETITAFICSRSEEKNQGNVLIVPNMQYENLYDIPDDVLARIHSLSKKVAIAMKQAYQCDGVSIRQHNEPAGNQEVWHYHLHVIPRYEGDDLYSHYGTRKTSDSGVRAKYAEQLRAFLQ